MDAPGNVEFLVQKYMATVSLHLGNTYPHIYNLFLILGFTSLFNSFSYNKEVLTNDVIFLSLSAILFTILMQKRIIIGTKIAFIFLIIYLIYLGNLYFSNF